VNTKQQRIAFWLSLILSFASLAAMGIIDNYLKGESSPLGITSFELCAYQSTCEAITASWQGITQSMAAMSLGIDYLFMLTYPAALFFGLTLSSQNLPNALSRLSVFFAWAIWLAGVADAVENYHLFQMLIGHGVANHQWPATVAATIKFIILIPALLLWLISIALQRVASTRWVKVNTQQ
jgi:hypothetical protein